MKQGQYTIPSRIYLTAGQRDKLMHLVREQQIDVPELLTELLVSFLDHLPETEQAEVLASVEAEETSPATLQTTIKKRRSEIRRLKARLTTTTETPPAWIQPYLTQLEQEVRRMEEELAKNTA
jgi:hypothetical protein